MTHRMTLRPVSAHTKGQIRSLRRSGLVPVSLQHRGEETVHLETEAKPLDEFIRQHGTAMMFDVVVEPGGAQTVLVHGVQRDPLSHGLLQVTLQKVVRGEPIKTHIPVILSGEPQAVRERTAILQHQTETVEVRCLPKDLPDRLVADVSDLTFHDPLRVGSLRHSDAVEILTSADTVVASLAALQAHLAPEETAVPEAEPTAETAS